MRIVLTHGCFDILHIGHHLYLEQARAMGDILFVSVSSDEAIRKIKPGRPIICQEDRVLQLKNLRFVDAVFLSHHPTGAQSIREVMPSIFVRGIDYSKKGLHPEEEKACRDVRCEIRFTNTPKHSSSDLIRWIR